ncbi:DUF2804 domain-containing protein [Actinomadura barringtoniae]|uniref:DUF2804 domain-containing protein n=1 Tax=Actinomadura barringtoniae TaxID=1427535 RepID=A0A939PG73_9ACTN|nr:DUF2804 domain-containing protein [Actinomadura barringtoniae]MBO2451667.1 DUF2804 domain-containing protein [Actinomadura barringtoniae]
MEQEITEGVELCLADGRLNPGAVGWTRRPLHRANLRGWGRVKRWEYWGIVTPTHIVGLVASSLDYAGVYGVYVLDRESGVETSKDVAVPFARGVVMPDRSGVGTAAVRGGGVRIEIRNGDGGTRIRAVAPGVMVDVEVALPEGHESLGVVVPWGTKRFQYTVKDLGRPVTGRLKVHGREFVVEDAFAVLDHGRGKWPYSVRWNWAAGSEPGGGRAIQLGGQWTDGTGMTENGLFVDGRLHKIHDELTWEQPWRISGARVEVEFRPFHVRRARTELGLVGNRTEQCFGHFIGRAQTDEGAWIDLDGLTGWAEEVHNRW